MNWLDLLTPTMVHKDRRSPLYLRITERIRGAIESGQLVHEQQLPTDRELAKLLKIDRSTVSRAYDQLSAEGLVYSHVGRGTFVTGSAQAASQPVKAKRLDYDGIVWADRFSRASNSVDAIVQRQPVFNQQADTISFAAGSPTEEFFPAKDFESIVQELLASKQAPEMFSYSQPEGHPKLRAAVLSYLKQQGIEATDDELLIVSGSQQAIDLVARTLINPDDAVLTEDPTYFWAICTFAANGGRCVPVATGPEGVRLDVFESVASRVDAKLFYVMPSFNNPTGSTMSVDLRQKLLKLARQYQVPILEDNFVGDLCYSDPLPTLRSLDGSSGSVIYQGTFSKALCPGLRLGWLLAPPQVMARIRLVKRTCDLSTNTLSQLILAEYLERGLYSTHLTTVCAAYKERRDTMCSALKEQAGQFLTFQIPEGGMFVWAKLPPGYSARELLTFAQREGVIYNPGDVFYTSSGNSEYMRLNFIQQNCEQIEEGVKRLTKALQTYSNSRKKALHSSGAYVVAESTFI